jgi:hypothetical protein
MSDTELIDVLRLLERPSQLRHAPLSDVTELLRAAAERLQQLTDERAAMVQVGWWAKPPFGVWTYLPVSHSVAVEEQLPMFVRWVAAGSSVEGDTP